MIYITQGKRGSIGLEALLKAILVIPSAYHQHIKLIIESNDLKHEVETLNIPAYISQEQLQFHHGSIDLIVPRRIDNSETLNALLTALPLMNEIDILLTLPSSKDQFNFQNAAYRGYTDFFRNYFRNNDISMTFKGIHFDLLLLTDHIPLREVADRINKDIFRKVEITLHNNKKYFNSYQDVIFLGLNPHAGENGQIGKEELSFENFLNPLRNKFPETSFLGPFAADAIFLKGFKSKKKTLIVSAYHDQGLPIFKTLNMFHSAQVTFGLPFLRLSVVHGTAEDIYGKNLADPTSLLYGLDKIFTSYYGLHLNRTCP